LRTPSGRGKHDTEAVSPHATRPATDVAAIAGSNAFGIPKTIALMSTSMMSGLFRSRI